MMVSSSRAFIVLGALAHAAGCAPLVARSSAGVLGPQGSSVVVRRAPAEAADELVYLFGDRGFTVVDHRQDGPGIALRLAGWYRRLDETYNRQIGSAYYVFVAPHGEGQSSITIVGRPTLDAEELCTEDLRLAEELCVHRHGLPNLQEHLDGRAEAQLVHGVLSALRARGAVDGAAAPSRRIALEPTACSMQRKEALARAEAHPDARMRAIAYARANRDFPSCN
jgi:hypothetical protein